MADKKHMERLGREYVGELLDLASGGGYADYVARADVESGGLRFWRHVRSYG